jgi:tripartite-type tricarboxylate transporter receptor subunit TctC
MTLMPARLAIAALVLATLPLGAAAQAPTDFYRGKTVSLYIGFSAGGGYDLYGRVIARHMGRHLPGNPQVVPRNMEGAGSMRAANFMTQAAPRDGTAFATIGRGTPLSALFGQSGAQYDPRKWTWLGSANDEVSLCVAWHTSGIARFEDLRMREKAFGATGPSEEGVQIVKAMNALLGTKLRIVPGYPGSNEINLAVERGEVDGRCAISWSSIKATHQAWLDQKRLNLLAQVSFSRHSDLPGVPLLSDFAQTDEAKQILKFLAARQVMGRPFFAPPEIPADRAAALRMAFMDTLQDPEFLAEAERAKLEITPVTAERIEGLLQDLYAMPAGVVQRATALFN